MLLLYYVLLLKLFYRYLTFQLTVRKICIFSWSGWVNGVTPQVFLQVILFFEAKRTVWVLVNCFSEDKKVTFGALCSSINTKILRREGWITIFVLPLCFSNYSVKITYSIHSQHWWARFWNTQQFVLKALLQWNCLKKWEFVNVPRFKI